MRFEEVLPELAFQALHLSELHRGGRVPGLETNFHIEKESLTKRK